MFHFGIDLPESVEREEMSVMTDKDFIEREIARWKVSKRRQEMLIGQRYFSGDHDILLKRRTAIGENGEPVEIQNIPNNRIVDNQYAKMVVQKSNYLLGQPLTWQSDNKAFTDALNDLCGKRFHKLMKNLSKDVQNEGIGWIFPTYDENGYFVFKKLMGHEIIPGWRDGDHTILEYAIRVYPMLSYTKNNEEIIEKVEVYDETGISYFELDGGTLVPEEPYHQPYFFMLDEKTGINYGYNWSKIPLIAFKRDSKEIPLIRKVKSLQDALNDILSNFKNGMDEDPRNTILVLVNYDGENLGEFRRNLATYGAVKVKTVDGAAGDLRTLEIKVNSENYKSIIEIIKKAIIENAMGYDAKDDRLGGQPNQMNIQSMYSDIDLDTNETETEFQAAFEELVWFIRCHFANSGIGNFENDRLEVIFNRDLPMVESEVISNIRESIGILSDETLIAQHPWVDDVQAELERKRKQDLQEKEDLFGESNPFSNQNRNKDQNSNNNGGGDDE